MDKVIRSSVVISELKKIVNKKTRYVWGAQGQKLTEEFLKKQINTFSSWYAKKNRGADLMAEFRRGDLDGAFGFDCSGLVLAVSLYGWKEDGTLKSTKNAGFDTTANSLKDMFEGAVNIGSNTQDWYNKNLVPGMALWMDGHIGFFIGDGKVIEATVSGNKVICVTPEYRKGRNWKIAGKLPWVIYTEGKTATKTEVAKTAKAQYVSSIKSDLKKSTMLLKAIRMLMYLENGKLYAKIGSDLNNEKFDGAKAEAVGSYTPMAFGNIRSNSTKPYISNGSKSYYKDNGEKFSLGEKIVYDPSTKRTPLKQAIDLCEAEYYDYLGDFLSAAEKHYSGKVDFSKMTDYELGAVGSLIYLRGSGILTNDASFNKNWTAAFVAHQNAKRTNGDVKAALKQLKSVWDTNSSASAERNTMEFTFYCTGSTEVDTSISTGGGTSSSSSSSSSTGSYYQGVIESGTFDVSEEWNYEDEEETELSETSEIDDGTDNGEIEVEVNEFPIDEFTEEDVPEVPTQVENGSSATGAVAGEKVIIPMENFDIITKAKGVDAKQEEFITTINADGTLNINTTIVGDNKKNYALDNPLSLNKTYRPIEITSTSMKLEEFQIARTEAQKVEIKIDETVKEGNALEELIGAKIVNSGNGDNYVVYGTSLFNLFESYISFVDEHFIWEDTLKSRIYDKFQETEKFTKEMKSPVYRELFMILIEPILERFAITEPGESYSKTENTWTIWNSQIANRVMFDAEYKEFPITFTINQDGFSEEKKESVKRFTSEFMNSTQHIGYTQRFGFGFEMRDKYKRVMSPLGIYSILMNMAGLIYFLLDKQDDEKVKNYFTINNLEKMELDKKIKAAETNPTKDIESYLNNIAEGEKQYYKNEISRLKNKFGINTSAQNAKGLDNKAFIDFWNLMIFLMLYYYIKNTKKYERISKIYNETDLEKRESIKKSFEAFKDYIEAEEIKRGQLNKNETHDNRFEEIADKYKNVYKSIAYKMLFIKSANWTTRNNSLFSWADEFFRFFATGYNYSTKESKSIASNLVADIPFDKMQYIAKTIRKDIASATDFVSEILNLIFVEMGILKNLKNLSDSLTELGSAFDLIKPRLFPKTPPNLKGASIRALLGVASTTTIVFAINFLLNKKIGKLGWTPMEMYENLVTVDNVAKSIDNGDGKQKVLNSFFSFENDAFYKKAKKAGYGFYTLSKNLSLYENTKTFLDLNFSDDYLKVIAEKLAVDIDVIKIGKFTVEAKFPLFFAFSNYLQYKYRLKNNIDTIFSSTDLFNSEYRNVTTDEFKIFLYVFYMKNSGGSYSINTSSFLDKVEQDDALDKNSGGTVVDLTLDRTWVNTLNSISRVLYNYPEIDTYKYAIDYKRDSKDFAEREKILNFYLDGENNRPGIDKMLSEKRTEIMKGLEYYSKNKNIFDSCAKEYVKSKRKECTMLDAYSKLEPSVDIVLDAIGVQTDTSIKVSDLTGKMVKAVDGFMETFIQPALRKQMEQIENLNLILSFNEKEVIKFDEFKNILELAEYLNTAVAMIEDILQNSKKYQDKWFL